MNEGYNNNNNNNNNLYFKRVTPITIKSILPSGPLKTKSLFTIVIIIKDLQNSKQVFSLPSGPLKTKLITIKLQQS